MANPQKENGFTPIANELLEALARIRIPGEAMQVLWVILRKTYGFGKKEDWICLEQFQTLTGLSKPHVIQALHKLRALNIITKNRNEITNKGKIENITYSINKDYDRWQPLPKKVTFPKKVMDVSDNDNLPVPKTVPTKDNITKDNLTIDIITVKSATVADFTALYHSLCPFGTKVQAMSHKRLGCIKTILKLHPKLTWWENLLADKVGSSAFLRGEIPPSGGHKQFKLTIDFLCVEHNLVKIIEGNYDDRSDSSRKSSFLDQL
jgi:phage replication O-like protein O